MLLISAPRQRERIAHACWSPATSPIAVWLFSFPSLPMRGLYPDATPFLSVGPQAIAKYIKYFAFLGSRPGTNHALAEKESSKAKPRFFIYFPRQIEVEERGGRSRGTVQGFRKQRQRGTSILQGYPAESAFPDTGTGEKERERK